MRYLVAIFLGFLVMFLVGCSKPLPNDKMDYAGIWRNENIVLVIAKEGRVDYKKCVGKVTTSISAPIKAFKGDDFEVGVGPLATIFKVSKPPYRDGKDWKMVVDEQVLTRDGSSE